MTAIDLDECHDVTGGFLQICEPPFPSPFPGPTFPGPILPEPFPLAVTWRMPICAVID